MCLSLGTALPFYQLSLAQLSLSLFLLFYSSYLCIPKLRPASRNMAQHCGSKSHNHPSRIHYVLVFFFLKCRKAKYVQHRVCFVIVQVPCPHSNIYVKLCTSRLCIKMSSFLFVRGCAMPRILYLSCEVPFPVWTPEDISGLISVVPWLSREELSKKNCR